MTPEDRERIRAKLDAPYKGIQRTFGVRDVRGLLDALEASEARLCGWHEGIRSTLVERAERAEARARELAAALETAAKWAEMAEYSLAHGEVPEMDPVIAKWHALSSDAIEPPAKPDFVREAEQHPIWFESGVQWYKCRPVARDAIEPPAAKE